MRDYLVKAYAFDGTARIYATSTTHLVEQARKTHDTWPAASAVFDRMLTASLIMDALYEGNQMLTIRIEGNGPIGKIISVVNTHGIVKGTIENPHVHFSKEDKLDVGKAVGHEGYINVTKDLKIRDVFTSSTKLQTGEIAEDFTYYFAKSEQIPSSVGLGVLVNEKNEVFASGGFIIQAMPGIKVETITEIEENIKHMKSVSKLIEENYSPEQIVNEITKGKHKFVEEMNLYYECDCSKERFEKGLGSLDKLEIEDMIQDNKPIEIICQFCKEKYNFTIDELKVIKQKKDS